MPAPLVTTIADRLAAPAGRSGITLASPLIFENPGDAPSAGIALAQQAWLSSATGNDSTAALGSPALPYRTAQAAYTAGARVLWLNNEGSGNYGDLTVTGNLTLSIIGTGAGSALGNVTASGNLNLRGNGNAMVSAGAVYSSGGTVTAQGLTAATVAGLSAMTLTADVVSGSLDFVGTQPVKTGPGQDLPSANASAVTLTDCTVATITLIAANGANGWDDGMGTADNGSAGGNGGTLTLLRCLVGSFEADGGGGGTGISGGTDGAAGTQGTLHATASTVASINQVAIGAIVDSTINSALTDTVARTVHALTITGDLSISGLPTSASGLGSGRIWNNGGNLAIT